jgi:hypothetical protein
VLTESDIAESRGLRRGEAVGQDWHEIDLDAGLITPAEEIVADGWDSYESEPTTDGRASTIALDSVSIPSPVNARSSTTKAGPACRPYPSTRASLRGPRRQPHPSPAVTRLR